MKPISVKFQGFGPYQDEQTVDFGAVARNGLFLIRGETGAGKTTILDAICCALYGQSSNGDRAGQPGRGGLEAMRCRSAPQDLETRVEFVFRQDGREYVFFCRLRPNRAGNLTEEEKCAVRLPDGTEQLLASKKTDVWRKAEEIIGLKAEQFRQVIVLPQGKFQQLLVSDDKAPILSSLFNAGRLKAAGKAFRDQAEAEGKRIKSEYEQITSLLNHWECDTVAALGEKAAAGRTELRGMRETLEAKRQRQQKAHDALRAAAKTEERFAALDQARAALKTLLGGAAEHEANVAALEAANRAAQAQPARDALRQAEQRAETATRELARAGQAMKDARAAGVKAAADADLHGRGQAEQDARKNRFTLLDSKREDYNRVQTLKAEWEAQRKRWPDAEKWEREAGEALQRSEEALEQCRKAADSAKKAYGDMAEQYLAEIAGELGMQLRDGVACPVCGSTHHPAPAGISGNHVTKAQVDKQKAAMDKADQAVRDQEALCDKKKKEYDRGREAKEQLRADIAAKEALYLDAQSQLPADIPDAAALEKVLNSLQTAIKAWDRETERLQKAVTETASAAASAEGVCRAKEAEDADARAALAAAGQAWTSKRLEAGFDDDASWEQAWKPQQRVQQLQSDASTYEARLQDCRKGEADAAEAVRDLQRPDMAALQAEKDAAEADYTGTVANLSSLEQRLADMEKALANLQARSEQLEKDRLINEKDRTVGDALVGLRGKVSLEDYMLSAMLSSVTVEANRLLADMYSGRFQLTVPSGGSLQLEVLDRDFDVRGNVASLSGGEKFLVALALGIGLANVVSTQHHSVNMDAMFIDEGFGSLDPKACQEAVSVLNSLRGSRMVGVISHVESLKEDISSQLVAVKTPRGSKLEQR